MLDARVAIEPSADNLSSELFNRTSGAARSFAE